MFLQVPSGSSKFLDVPLGSLTQVEFNSRWAFQLVMHPYLGVHHEGSSPHYYHKITPTSPNEWSLWENSTSIPLFRGNSHSLAAPYFPEKLCFIKRKSFHARLHTQWCKVLRKRMWASSVVAFKSETSEWASPHPSLVPYLVLLKEGKGGQTITKSWKCLKEKYVIRKIFSYIPKVVL